MLIQELVVRAASQVIAGVHTNALGFDDLSCYLFNQPTVGTYQVPAPGDADTDPSIQHTRRTSWHSFA